MRKRKSAFGALSMSDAEILSAALIGLELQRGQIVEKMAELRQRLQGRLPAQASRGNTAAPTVPKRRTMSAAGRRRVAEAQRKRWSKLKKTQAPKSALARKKRRISAAGMKRIVAATKKRWAAFHAKKAAATKP